MKEVKAMGKKVKNLTGVGLLSLAGGAALVLVAAAVVAMLPDIKRYIKISSM
jgi:hypothetical protein